MAFFGTGTSFSRAYNQTLTGNPYTPPSYDLGGPRSSSDSPRASMTPHDSVTLSQEASGSQRSTPMTESEIKMRLQAQKMQVQLINAQLQHFQQQFGN